MQFERSDLFKAIKENFHCTTVLYPGSFIHITPSFFFPHVVYVDTNEVAQEFFAEKEDVLSFIKSNKKYKQSSFIRFINQDFTNSLPLKDNTFDLLISLYAGGIFHACQKYLKIGGILLTNNHLDDANEAALNDEYKLIASVIRKNDAYIISEKQPGEDVIPLKNPSSKKTYLKQYNMRLVYTDNEDYFLFKRVSVK
jgi:hypothetical protein